MYPESRMEYEITVTDFKKIKDFLPETSYGKVCILDVREPWEAETAVIPGSCLMPMGEIPVRAHEQLDKDAHIVVYCHHGHRSLNVVLWLREQGFSRSQSLAGGIDAWSQAVDPSVPRY